MKAWPSTEPKIMIIYYIYIYEKAVSVHNVRLYKPVHTSH